MKNVKLVFLEFFIKLFLFICMNKYIETNGCSNFNNRFYVIALYNIKDLYAQESFPDQRVICLYELRQHCKLHLLLPV